MRPGIELYLSIPTLMQHRKICCDHTHQMFCLYTVLVSKILYSNTQLPPQSIVKEKMNKVCKRDYLFALGALNHVSIVTALIVVFTHKKWEVSACEFPWALCPRSQTLCARRKWEVTMLYHSQWSCQGMAIFFWSQHANLVDSQSVEG